MTEKSSACPHVYTAINAVMATMAKEGIGKDRRNQQQGYNFRGIDDVYNTLCGVMSAEKLIILPSVADMDREERATAKGGVLIYTILTVDFTFVSAVDGSTCQARMKGEAMDSGDKSCNKAQSAAMKYATLQVFMIPTEGNNDADATTHEVVARGKSEPPTAAITNKQFLEIQDLAVRANISAETICKTYKVDAVTKLPAAKFDEVVTRLKAEVAKKEQASSFGEVNDVEFAN